MISSPLEKITTRISKKLYKELGMTEVPYIGHLLTSEGIKPDPKKVEAVQKVPQPTDVSSVKRFL